MVDAAATRASEANSEKDDILPDHTQLPESDGTFVKNFQEHPQSLLLTDSIETVLNKRHPDGNYAIGQDCGIYWRQADPPEKGAEAPDWFYVPDVPPKLDGQFRRSYVLWKEYVAPLIAIEFASGDGREERDRTPLLRLNETESTKPGKFWVYERVIRIPYYAIYVAKTAQLEMYRLVGDSYERMEANEQGRFEIAPLGVQLGVWTGSYINQIETWMRWWDSDGNLLLTGHEEAALAREETQQAREETAQAREEVQQAKEDAQQASARAKKLAQKLAALGIDPDTV